MCLGIPAQVVEKGDGTAVVEIGGVRREISLALIEEAANGDWVVVHAGFAIQKLDPGEAEKTLALFKEIADAVP